jgi:uncharacterized membrane protein
MAELLGQLQAHSAINFASLAATQWRVATAHWGRLAGFFLVPVIGISMAQSVACDAF